MIVGYARTSTTDQAAGLAAQERDLMAAGADRIFGEQVSSTAKRVKLAECLAFMREGDVLTVTSSTAMNGMQCTSGWSRNGCASSPLKILPRRRWTR
jgi:hypothetical protein